MRHHVIRIFAIVLAATVVTAVACQSSERTDGAASSTDAASTCTQGHSRQCDCPSGADGVQVCTDSGEWGGCVCPGEGGDAGPDAVDSGGDEDSTGDPRSNDTTGPDGDAPGGDGRQARPEDAGPRYDTIVVSEGESERIEVESGETLDNVLIDVTADGAEAQIVAEGDDWTIRNVAFRGTVDTGFEDGGEQHSMMDLAGNGVVEHCYLGDGVESDVRRGGITFRSWQHDGHVTIRHCYIARWSDNAIYSAGAARSDAENGTVGVENCYFHDNNVAHLRIASDGSYARGCIVHNTGNVPAGNTHVHSKGVYTGYGDADQRVTIDECHFDITGANTNGDNNAFNSPPNSWDSSTDSEIYIENTEFVGSDVGHVTFGPGNGDDPDLTPPSGVPMTAEEAASGGNDR